MSVSSVDKVPAVCDLVEPAGEGSRQEAAGAHEDLLLLFDVEGCTSTPGIAGSGKASDLSSSPLPSGMMTFSNDHAPITHRHDEPHSLHTHTRSGSKDQMLRKIMRDKYYRDGSLFHKCFRHDNYAKVRCSCYHVRGATVAAGNVHTYRTAVEYAIELG